MNTRWRDMGVTDLEVVGHLGDTYHPPHLWEPPEAIAARLALPGSRCFILEAGSALAGYCIAHPWDDTIPPLREALQPRQRPSRLFLHDVVVHPSYRGSGHAAAIVWHVLAEGRLSHGGPTGLIAVNGTQEYWSRFGFYPQPADVKTYGADALYMVRP